MKFYIVDAFTEKIFGGNPAGVVVLDKGSNFPDDEIMRKTAAELRYSETAFIKFISDKEFNIRYFTPADEVDLCGHATIGSFCALLSAGIVKDNSSYIIDTLAGRLNVVINNGSIMMDMGIPAFLGKIDSDDALEELYSVMGLDYNKVTVGSALLPELISTGLPDIMMPVNTREDLAKIKPDFPALSKLSEKYNVTGVHAFTLGDDKITAYCRNFAPLYEIDEEAATGTSNGALTYYLYKNEVIKDGSKNVFLQGESMGRPSKIEGCLTLSKDTDDNIKIQVGGNGVILARGEIFI